MKKHWFANLLLLACCICLPIGVCYLAGMLACVSPYLAVTFVFSVASSFLMIFPGKKGGEE